MESVTVNKYRLLRGGWGQHLQDNNRWGRVLTYMRVHTKTHTRREVLQWLSKSWHEWLQVGLEWERTHHTAPCRQRCATLHLEPPQFLSQEAFCARVSLQPAGLLWSSSDDDDDKIKGFDGCRCVISSERLTAQAATSSLISRMQLLSSLVCAPSYFLWFWLLFFFNKEKLDCMILIDSEVLRSKRKKYDSDYIF